MADTTTISTVPTLADLLEHFGWIPPERIRFHPVPGTATEDDVIAEHDRNNRLCELVDGVLVEKAMGFYESRLAVVLVHSLETFLEDQGLGIVVGADGMMRLSAGLVRIPDVAFIEWHRLPGRKIPSDAIPDLAPDLAVEVLSESNTPAEMERKLHEYFDAGTRLVWYLDPVERIVTVFTSPEESTVLSEADTIDGGTVLPGFRLPVREWLARAGERSDSR